MSDRIPPNVIALLEERDGKLPVWVRAPSKGPEHYSGLSKPVLYNLASEGKIRSKCLKTDPGKSRGIRLFQLSTILTFIDSIPDDK